MIDELPRGFDPEQKTRCNWIAAIVGSVIGGVTADIKNLAEGKTPWGNSKDWWRDEGIGVSLGGLGGYAGAAAGGAAGSIGGALGSTAGEATGTATGALAGGAAGGAAGGTAGGTVGGVAGGVAGDLGAATGTAAGTIAAGAGAATGEATGAAFGSAAGSVAADAGAATGSAAALGAAARQAATGAVGNAATGAIKSAATGQDPMMGAATGAASGFVGGGLSGAFSPTTSVPTQVGFGGNSDGAGFSGLANDFAGTPSMIPNVSGGGIGNTLLRESRNSLVYGAPKVAGMGARGAVASAMMPPMPMQPPMSPYRSGYVGNRYMTRQGGYGGGNGSRAFGQPYIGSSY